MPPKAIKVSRPNGDVARKFYLPVKLDEYIRETAKKNFRTFNGQIEAMLQHAKGAGI